MGDALSRSVLPDEGVVEKRMRLTPGSLVCSREPGAYRSTARNRERCRFTLDYCDDLRFTQTLAPAASLATPGFWIILSGLSLCDYDTRPAICEIYKSANGPEDAGD